MAYFLSPVGNEQHFDNTGAPANGYKLFVYIAGSSTLATTYTDSTGSTPNANPIVMDSTGYPAAGATKVGIWLATGVTYKFIYTVPGETDFPSTSIWTLDVISGVNDTTSSVSEWISGPTATYVSSSKFVMDGDQTTVFHVNRALKVTLNASTIYDYISAVDYNITTPLKTTVTTGGTSLTNPITSVSYGILSANNISTPHNIVHLDGTETITGNKTFSGTVTMSGKSILDANASVAANATTSNIWSSGNYVTLTGTAVTFTNFANAPQAGAEVELYCNDTHTFTNNSNLVIDGSANFTSAVGDRIRVRAKSTTVFTLKPIKADGTPISTSSAQGSSVVLLGSYTVSGVAKASIVIGSSAGDLIKDFTIYDSVEFELVDVFGTVAGNTAFQVQYYTDGGTTPISSATYSRQGISGTSNTGTNGADQSRGVSALIVGSASDTAHSSTGLSGILTFRKPTSSSKFKTIRYDTLAGDETNSGDIFFYSGAGHCTGSGATINGIKLFFASGNIEIGSTVYVRGYKKS